MKFISSALVTTLVIKSVLGDVPTKEMFEATTLEQFREANEAWKPTTKTIRRRATEEVSYPKIAADFGGLPGFYHGVASGDPLPDAIILWTRYTPESDSDVVELEYRIAEYDPAIQLDDHLDPSKNMKKMIVGREFVDASTDFTLKLDVTGLEPLKEYVYAFTDGSVVSQVGKTKTAPGDKNVESLIYATFSCAHFSNGYFHAYDIASTIKDLDFWVHVGDYIYEYGGYGNYATASAERRAQTDPWWEIVDLQDYRNRFAQYHTDEALQSLHRAAPMIAQWDDHELTNNAYGLGVEGTLGAENHQPSCSANPDSTDAEKNTAKCDRDEGNATIRFNNAVRAYMEWLPIRAAPGDLGVVALSNVRTIEWGSIADFVVVDTRISQRSKNPALASVFGQFGFAYVDADYENYATNPTYQGIANTTLNEQYNPEYTMIGNHKEYLRGQFEKSKAAGKPFQVFVAATMMGPQVPLNPSKMYQLVPPEAQEIIKASLDSILASGSGGFFRAMTAMEELRVPWNADGYDGYSHERAELLDMFKTAANNVIVLAGDLHDSWAWTLYEGGVHDGTPVAVNLGAQGVTSPGWGGLLISAFSGFKDLVGGDEGVKEWIHAGWRAANPGLKYADIYGKGFFAVKMTKTECVTEYFQVGAADMLSDYETARNNSGSITSAFTCGGGLLTLANQPGSLEPQSCSAIEFENVRPAFFEMSVPASFTCMDNRRSKFEFPKGNKLSCYNLSKKPAHKRARICANNADAAATCPDTCSGRVCSW